MLLIHSSQGENRQKSDNNEVSSKGILLFVAWVIALCVIGILPMTLTSGAMSENAFELMAATIIVVTIMVGLQKNYSKSKKQ
ncbi:MAG: hypothetical protein AAEF72_06400 [Gammaproteobacteria bacterium]